MIFLVGKKLSAVFWTIFSQNPKNYPNNYVNDMIAQPYPRGCQWDPAECVEVFVGCCSDNRGGRSYCLHHLGNFLELGEKSSKKSLTISPQIAKNHPKLSKNVRKRRFLDDFGQFLPTQKNRIKLRIELCQFPQNWIVQKSNLHASPTPKWRGKSPALMIIW